MPTPFVDEIETQCDPLMDTTISQEGLSELIASKVPNLHMALKQGFDFLTTWDYSQPTMLSAVSVKGKLGRFRFTDIETTPVAKPVGFQGELTDYVQVLSPIVTQMTTLPKYLEAIERQLGGFLNDPAELKERRFKSVADREGFSEAQYQRLTQSLATFTKQDSTDSRTTLESLYGSNQDIVAVMLKTNELNTTRWKACPPKQVAEAAQRMNIIAMTLLDQVGSAGSNASREAMAYIAQEVRMGARWTSFYAVLLTRLIDLTGALEDQQKALMRL